MQSHYAIFGGSFNPIHQGHVSIVEYLMSLDTHKIIVIPTSRSPLKTQNHQLPNTLRLEMVRQAFQGWDNVIVSDIELKTNQIQYTHNTLKYLSKQYPNVGWRLVIGLDAYKDFAKWKNAQWITENTSLWIVQRSGLPLQTRNLEAILKTPISEFVDHLLWDSKQQTISSHGREIAKFLNCTPPQISSTEIRNQQKSTHWIPSSARTTYEKFINKSSSIEAEL